jgi:hypothetical protein
MKYYLSEDVYSGKENKRIASKGDEVKLISKLEEHLTVVIVEDKKGNRFSASVKVLSETKG